MTHVDVNVNSVVSVDINSEEAFKILCKTLHMEFVLDEKTDYFIKKDDLGHNCVYYLVGEQERKYESRGDLFIALRNVAVNLFPNIKFCNAPYIYGEDKNNEHGGIYGQTRI